MEVAERRVDQGKISDVESGLKGFHQMAPVKVDAVYHRKVLQQVKKGRAPEKPIMFNEKKETTRLKASSDQSRFRLGR